MTSGANQRSTVKSLAGLPLAESKTDRLAALHAALSPHLATIRTRRGQNVTLMAEGGEAAFIVRTGVLTVSVTMPGTSRQLVAILFPGDVLCSGFVPCEADATLTPAAPASCGGCAGRSLPNSRRRMRPLPASTTRRST